MQRGDLRKGQKRSDLRMWKGPCLGSYEQGTDRDRWVHRWDQIGKRDVMMRVPLGTVRLRLISGDVTSSLARCNSKGIILRDVRFLDPLTAEFTAEGNKVASLQKIVEKSGDSLTVLKEDKRGILIGSILRRPIFLAAFVIFLALSAFLPKRIFFIQVQGNETVSEKLIIEYAETAGVYFGAARNQIRSERIKNELLEKIPELKWVGVNTNGCVATISVREKAPQEKKQETAAARIVAGRDALITSCVVRKGNPLCKVGQTVTKDQTLVSGLTDVGISIENSGADAEIYGHTTRELQVILPDPAVKWEERITGNTEYSLLVGKNLINLRKDSGILGNRCVKMYTQKYVTLPGDFTLPVAVVQERTLSCEKTSTSIDLSEQILRGFAADYLKDQMIAGTILSDVTYIRRERDATILEGTYYCNEMISRMQYEETDLYYEQNN